MEDYETLYWRDYNYDLSYQFTYSVQHQYYYNSYYEEQCIIGNYQENTFYLTVDGEKWQLNKCTGKKEKVPKK